MGNLPVFQIDLPLSPAPINPSWIEAGAPVARNRLLSRSSDRTAWTMLWDCSEGEFRWRYRFDEAIHFLDGAVTITLEGDAPRDLGPGDVIFFKAGDVAHWKVHSHVRKLAFCQTPAPRTLRLVNSAVRRIEAAWRGLFAHRPTASSGLGV